MVLKKIERKISWNIYLAAFIISLVIFSVGIWFGLQIEKTVSEQMNERIQAIGNKLATLSVLTLLENESEYCEYLNNELSKFWEETYELGKQIEFMEEKRGADDYIKANYMELELRDYLLNKKVKQICGDTRNLILYFVNSDECRLCRQQGEIITSVRMKTNTKVYTFDLAINSTLNRALISKYRIDSGRLPAIVINEKVYYGFMGENELISKLS
ncbi:MAG: hypothetical protein N3G74_00570 [Candidatus Micrarchaeota archaeon]|nr:hypothetical protein [Candidatus Micrarchaeota archaeon]